ncbi:V-type ATP synthase subunit A [Methanosarcinales archaeon ex4484_138]|nr:MAG: V-type ATP synthase subunit A [Methanosarcinales archaeon ex4484_138]
MEVKGEIYRISGPVVTALGINARMYDVVKVGDEGLMGEVIGIEGEKTIIQVYEDTSAVKPGEPVIDTGMPLSVELGPGLLESIYDGIQRPLPVLLEKMGDFIQRGVSASGLDHDKKWEFKPWPVRRPRPVAEKLRPTIPLITGQRIFDGLFPLAKGGTAAIPGPFGSGKTVMQQQLAKWSDAEIVVYIGCGERGNEMADVLNEFPELEDPKTGRPLMERTVLIANTSNMPVAAREASVYTGITIAEYYRDMGYDVSLMADSTSRWAEAMREISSRLEEMPGEEGYPAYLAAKLAEFYERAGRTKALCGRDGSVTVIGAVSPPGGDFSEPVTQNTLRIVKVFWALDAKLAQRRHFPAINWLTSYSLYGRTFDEWYDENVSSEWTKLRGEAMNLLQLEAELQDIVQLVGSDALPDDQQLTLEVARMVREYFLQQNAYHDVDSYCPMKNQYKMLEAILAWGEKAVAALDSGVPVANIISLESKDTLAKVRFEADLDASLNAIMKKADLEFTGLRGE